MSKFDAAALDAWIKQTPQADYPFQSRIHPLRSLKNCFIKRDDELGFGISGSKIRKYRSLIPFLIQSAFEKIILIGSAYSNNITSLVQLLVENGLKPYLLLRGRPEDCTKGNGLLMRLFVSEESIQWIPKDEWPHIQAIADSHLRQSPQKSFLIPEGASCIESLAGTLSLPLDILRNEREANTVFNHYFIDSGTGLMAIGVILAFHAIQKNTTIHVILMAENESYFLKQLTLYWTYFKKMTKLNIQTFPANFILHRSGSPFGKVNREHIQSIKKITKTEGFLVDPVYMAKLFVRAEDIIGSQSLNGPHLIHHSGGGLSLLGFQDKLQG